MNNALETRYFLSAMTGAAVDNFAPGCYPFFILTMENSYDQDDII